MTTLILPLHYNFASWKSSLPWSRSLERHIIVQLINEFLLFIIVRTLFQQPKDDFVFGTRQTIVYC
ncbi:unnamed protein product [Arabidopsis halleri]